ncbi:hypothetical protein CC1G_15345 [Coprinopsis cinerea okayama7|uniref:Uncharacterized protein n=1 Tax=Coprinopsis cinerea (strain Okayama-7 / 130 / ATCC MYA-4618 / FGSC 9003) TaxID=240176 RepID=D6RQ24_COPC7|nr:hypothetical protein CC1G_15345 [Coprinopsis cinerea okayama7\|eukprot:XP_002910438.1 hypothetical protein CC1G_15345 [Coprinopsis cinerea okayama7\
MAKVGGSAPPIMSMRQARLRPFSVLVDNVRTASRRRIVDEFETSISHVSSGELHSVRELEFDRGLIIVIGASRKIQG